MGHLRELFRVFAARAIDSPNTVVNAGGAAATEFGDSYEIAAGDGGARKASCNIWTASGAPA